MMLLPSPPPRGYPSGRASPFPRTQRLLLKRYDINFILNYHPKDRYAVMHGGLFECFMGRVKTEVIGS